MRHADTVNVGIEYTMDDVGFGSYSLKENKDHIHVLQERAIDADGTNCRNQKNSAI